MKWWLTTVTRFSGAFVAVAGIIMAVAIAHGDQRLASFRDDWPTMKMATALAFVSSGLMLTVMRCKRREPWQDVVAGACLFSIFSTMGLMLAAGIAGVNLNLEQLFVQEPPGDALTNVPGRPSTATMVAFLLVAGAGLAWLFGRRTIERILSAAVAMIGAVCVVGFIIDSDLLRFYGVRSNGMALPTAILFVLCGLSGMGLPYRYLPKADVEAKA